MMANETGSVYQHDTNASRKKNYLGLGLPPPYALSYRQRACEMPEPCSINWNKKVAISCRSPESGMEKSQTYPNPLQEAYNKALGGH
jgi:hypothetical protein